MKNNWTTIKIDEYSMVLETTVGCYDFNL